MDTFPLDDAASQPNPGPEADLSSTQHLSKNAQKRAAKVARLHQLKLERRAREKEMKKHRHRERAMAIANGELDENTSRKRRKTNEAEAFNATVVVDLGFDELMSDREINSLTSQLAYTYSANRRAAHAFSVLVFTSLSGRTKQKLDAMNDAGYKRWARTVWWEEGFGRLWTEPQRPSEDIDVRSCASLPRADRENVIYLTADSSHELLEIKEGETYIIGGICDHNRYKDLCLNKAIDSQVRHARLPIGRYIALATRKVLTVNQVFEILLKWIDSHDWEEAFWAVIPKRKFQGGLRYQDKRERHEITGQDDGSGNGSAIGEATHTLRYEMEDSEMAKSTGV